MTTQANGRRRNRFLAVLALAGSLSTGTGLFVGGALAARDAADSAGALGVESTITPTTQPPTTTATPTTLPPTTTTTTTEAPAAADGSLESGEEGEEVSALQARLTDLGYWLGMPDGTYGHLTRQAVLAFQKAEGLSRDGVAGPATLLALGAAARPTPRDPGGSHIEIDLERQILLVVQDGQTRWVLNTSTGNGEAYAPPGGGSAVATTPRGTFAVEREIDGLREAPLGTLYRPKYFHGGIAIHGAGLVPAHPASHGCARVTNAAMDMLWASGGAELGIPVVVY